VAQQFHDLGLVGGELRVGHHLRRPLLATRRGAEAVIRVTDAQILGEVFKY
jgi:hypothetical protein